MENKLKLKVNGTEFDLNIDPQTPLLYVLRNDLELNGPKFGCGLGQCGACTILLDGKSVPSCQVPVAAVGNSEILTLEGLVDSEGKLHKVQQGFIDEQAAQCGYCLNGMVMASVALLNENSKPTEDQISTKLQGNICRCGVHSRVIRAVKRAVEQ